MEENKIAERIMSEFADAGLQASEEATDHVILSVPAGKLTGICKFLKQNDEMDFNTCTCITAVDNGENLTSVYHLFSYTHRHFCVLKVNVSRSDPHIPSLDKIWPGAGWFEREAFDLMGIVYDGNGDLRRIMLPDDWEGHPLRKDYEEKKEYHGMGTSRTNLLDAE